MEFELPTELTNVIARAFTSGTEISIERLAELLDLSAQGRLLAATKVIEFVERFHLELVPGVGYAEFETVRVLRAVDPGGAQLGRMHGLLSSGEGPNVEFKASMFCSMQDWQKKQQLIEFPSLQGEILKTVGAFLNTDGGDLFVGVSDDGSPCEGIELDLKLKGWNLDAWSLHFQSLVKDRFYEGFQVQPYLRTQMAVIDAFPILHVSVMARQTRSFVQREKAKPYEFFVRNGPRTDSLDLPAFYGRLRGNDASEWSP